MEAALAGVPVITTQVSGIQGIVECGVSGYVIQQGDEKAFIEAVKTLSSDSVLREHMSKAIREKAQNMLSIESMLKSQKAVYDYLI
jgi:glycosyltransferase involved in cell wall biosynthesis